MYLFPRVSIKMVLSRSDATQLLSPTGKERRCHIPAVFHSCGGRLPAEVWQRRACPDGSSASRSAAADQVRGFDVRVGLSCRWPLAGQSEQVFFNADHSRFFSLAIVSRYHCKHLRVHLLIMIISGKL